jgi:hypothetical protein
VFDTLVGGDPRYTTNCDGRGLDTFQGMSQENLEIVRKAFDAINAFGRGEDSGEAIAELLDPEVKIERDHEDARSAMDFMKWLAAIRKPADELELEPDEFIQADSHAVVPMTVRLVGRGEARLKFGSHGRGRSVSGILSVLACMGTGERRSAPSERIAVGVTGGTLDLQGRSPTFLRPAQRPQFRPRCLPLH